MGIVSWFYVLGETGSLAFMKFWIKFQLEGVSETLIIFSAALN